MRSKPSSVLATFLALASAAVINADDGVREPARARAPDRGGRDGWPSTPLPWPPPRPAMASTTSVPLVDMVGDAHLVALGEATHGTREFFQLKHRILELLVRERGFNVFAIEATMPEAFAVNDYVLTGRGDPAKALAGLYFWTWGHRRGAGDDPLDAGLETPIRATHGK